MARGHSNTLIPSTLHGAPYHQNGEYDLDTMKKNICAAIKEYIDRVDGTPVMGTTTRLMLGIEKSSFNSCRSFFLIFLKGKKDSKIKLKRAKPERCKHFSKISNLRERHMVKSKIPTKYIFLLKCCGEADCIHPLCSGEKPKLTRYKNGRARDVLPMPVVDVKSTFDGLPCRRCKKMCLGHYKANLPSSQDVEAPIPSELISMEFAANEEFDAQRIKDVAVRCLLPPKTVQFYVNHLKQVKINRDRSVENRRLTNIAKQNKKENKENKAQQRINKSRK